MFSLFYFTFFFSTISNIISSPSQDDEIEKENFIKVCHFVAIKQQAFVRNESVDKLLTRTETKTKRK